MAGDAIPVPHNVFPAPFTAIDLTYKGAFDLYLANVITSIEAAVAAPLLACVTLWVIVQGILVMRGDIDARRGVTKLLTVAIVIGLVSGGTLYHDYIQAMFQDSIPDMVRRMGGNFGLPVGALPLELDGVFRLGESGFQEVASRIPPNDEVDAIAFDGAQFFFYFTLWSIFGIFDLVQVMTDVLVSVGPLFIIGFLFEATAGIATRWIGQLIAYAIMLLLLLIIASVVVAVIAVAGGVIVEQLDADGTAQDIILLYELDFFILTGNALVVAVPALAASIGGGVGFSGSQMGESVFRRFSTYDRGAGVTSTPVQQILTAGAMQPAS